MLRLPTIIAIATTLSCGGAAGPLASDDTPLAGGFRWRLVTSAADWPPQRRLSHTFSYEGQIWLLDPLAGYWRTEDGSDWNPFSPTLPAQAFRHEILQFGGRLVGLRGDLPTDELWGSTDGETWTKIADGPPRTSGSRSAVVFQNRLWIFQADRIEEPLVWTTGDGTKWTQGATPPWGRRGDATFVVHDDRLWVIGGRRSVDGNPDQLVEMNDTWVTRDGVTWEHREWDLDWPGRLYYGVEAWEGRLWLLGGGEGGSNGQRNDVWTSTDGAHWELFDAEAPWRARFAMSVVVHGDKMFLFGGKEGSEQFFNDVWSLERVEDSN